MIIILGMEDEELEVEMEEYTDSAPAFSDFESGHIETDAE